MRVSLISSILFTYLMIFTSCTYSESQFSSGPQRSTSPQQSSEFHHAPYADRTCDACHGSEKPSARDVIDEPPKLCYNCHEEYSRAYVHSPVSMGECLICHDPHKSKVQFLLKQKLPDLCYLCHDRIQELMMNAQNVKHSPAVDDCVACHGPHASDTSTVFLKQDMHTLCTQCHIEQNVPMQSYVASVTHKHKPVEEKDGCAQCHAPHASPFDFHLRAEPMDLCLKCHSRTVIAYDGKELANMEALLRENPSWHGPIREKNCSGCHNPHGSLNFRLLNEGYPSSFYTEKFSLDNYDLCFSCHESTILRDKETTTLTNFRDGKRNLHFLHVNREEKGRTCRTCHETHASTHPKHITDSVPFGKIQWRIKLKYQVEYVDIKTGQPCDTPSSRCVESGGSCVGCHARKPYNYRKAD